MSTVDQNDAPIKQLGPWDWSIFSLLVFIAICYNLSWGTFQQIEEVVMISPENRGQTIEADFGWPIPFIATEAYTTKPIFYHSLSWTIALAVLDILITSCVVFAGTKYLSIIILLTQWKLSTLDVLVFTAVVASLVTAAKYRFWYTDAGVMSYVLFNCIQPLFYLCCVFAWHWSIR